MDSAARIVNCVQSAARDLDLEEPEDSSIRNIIGLSLPNAVDILFPSADSRLVDNISQRYRHHFLYENTTPSPLFEGAERVLRELGSQRYLLAVATGKGRRGLNLELASTGLGDLFHTTRCADEGFSKPNPGMLIQIMDELGVDAVDTLMIGDTEYDMQMAENAGAAALAVSYGAHEPERLLRHEPLGCVNAISEIVDWLG